jgi:hypothetical protein
VPAKLDAARKSDDRLSAVEREVASVTEPEPDLDRLARLYSGRRPQTRMGVLRDVRFGNRDLVENGGRSRRRYETTVLVSGSNTVSGIGSLTGCPWRSVPNGAGFSAVADDVVPSGSAIWYSVNALSSTTTCANEKSFDLNFAVIFSPAPASGKNAFMAAPAAAVSAGSCARDR